MCSNGGSHFSRENVMNSLRRTARLAHLSVLLQAFVLTVLLAGCQSVATMPDDAARQKIDGLLTLIDQRLDEAVKVAQTKWNSGAPINDPARERQILEKLAAGLSNKEIAQQLFLSEKTIKHYVTNILQKLHVRNRVAAALLAQNLSR